jgi:very-short-patch-repair endonuclease
LLTEVFVSSIYRDEQQRTRARRLRNEPTEAEKTLWRHLRDKQFHCYKFRRQARAPSVADGRGPYIVDFACFAHKLIIELDGRNTSRPTPSPTIIAALRG